MIQEISDLRQYIRRDAIRNEMYSIPKYLAYTIARDERTCAFRYLKCLRFCEFFYNNRGNRLFYLLYLFYRLKLSRMGRKYSIKIPINVCGYGIRIMHLGNNCFIAANALVTKDIPENSVVAGVPGKVIKQRCE